MAQDDGRILVKGCKTMSDTAPSVKFQCLLKPGDKPTREVLIAREKANRRNERIWAEQEILNALMSPTVIGPGLGLPLAPRYRRSKKG